MRICKVEGCSGKYYAKNYCVRHYNQIRKHGYIFGNPEKSNRHPNQFVFHGNICLIGLSSRYGEFKVWATIDIEDYEKVKNTKWSLSGNGYVQDNKGKTLLHSKIMLTPKTKVIDHIDRNPLNNKKVNLRIATRSQNGANSKMSSNNTSGFRGVCFDSKGKKWVAEIKENFKKISLGRFNSRTEAAKAYNSKAIKLFGKFATLNEINLK